jgi:hypothetical protein
MLGSERCCWDEVVVVGRVLADEATLSYQDISNMRVSVTLLGHTPCMFRQFM